jgi:hypothetical protein
MNISLYNLQKIIKELFDESKVTSVETVYEKNNDGEGFKVVIFIHNLFYNKTNIIYSKLLFLVDDQKVNLLKNHFTYLYDINCDYRRINFNDLDDLKSKLKKIFSMKLFGDDIKTLSDIMTHPSTLIDEWFKKNDLTEYNAYSFKYEPIVKVMPCEKLFFTFVLNLNNKENIEIVLIKINKSEYNLKFKCNDIIKESTIQILKDFINEIGIYIKENIKNN